MISLTLREVARHDPNLAKDLISAGADMTSEKPVDPGTIALAGSDAFVRFNALLDSVNAEAKAARRSTLESIGNVAAFIAAPIVSTGVAAGLTLWLAGPLLAAVAGGLTFLGVTEELMDSAKKSQKPEKTT